jgi:hypothetical protein
LVRSVNSHGKWCFNEHRLVEGRTPHCSNFTSCWTQTVPIETHRRGQSPDRS